jgi:D-tagatose-1,6-bisphosphate aldolase subunit GatZ/KbaZ
MENPLLAIFGTPGIPSLCTIHETVLQSAMVKALSHDQRLLVEVTPNQVNCSGGYSGLTPEDFAGHVRALAQKAGLPQDRLVLGADHAGPLIWRKEPAHKAMAKAAELVRAFVRAGYRKIHLDTGMTCADDPKGSLLPQTCAQRTTDLCRAAETAHGELSHDSSAPLYVIGAEVPVPGGGMDENLPVPVTDPAEVVHFLDLSRDRFHAAGLDFAWQRVAAVVVQPGVDFSDSKVSAYSKALGAPLSRLAAELPGAMIYEVHATDYQTPLVLRHLVEDHFAILKVGPQLTFTFREAVFALEHIETAWLSGRKSICLSALRKCLEKVMQKHPEHWQSPYRGNVERPAWIREFGLRDRIRYYWTQPTVQDALARLLVNLSDPIPLPLLSQYLPEQYRAIETEGLSPSPPALIRHRIGQVLNGYFSAAGMDF